MDLSQSNELIYIRLKEWLEDKILSGDFPENSKIPSVAELSVSFKLNHITVLKSVGILSDNGIIYKKRGVGMFVSEGAVKKIQEERHNEFYEKYILPAAREAKKLGIEIGELLDMTEKGFNSNIK